MNNDIVIPTLAERRAALIAECSMQRSDMSHQIAAMRPPSEGGLGLLGSVNLKVPLMIAGVVLGMAVVRPSRALPLLTTGLSLYKMAKNVLAIVRSRQLDTSQQI